MPIQITYRTCSSLAQPPAYMTSGASGMDVCAALEQQVTLAPLERILIPTGLSFEIPTGYEIQVRPRSGLALKHGITCLNTPGTIDSDYRGEVKVLLVNLSHQAYQISPGDRIAQLVVCSVEKAQLVQAVQLEQTVRGTGGFGHTGLSSNPPLAST